MHRPADHHALASVHAVGLETTLTLAAAHALVLLEDGIVGDPMEKTTIEALNWSLGVNDTLSPLPPAPAGEPKAKLEPLPGAPKIVVRRRYQFSSALKRMSTVSQVYLSGNVHKPKTFVAVKGAPETLRAMYDDVPEGYEATYKGFAQRGSRVLALGCKWLEGVGSDGQINKLERGQVEKGLTFVGFLVFNCPLKPDAVSTIRDLNDASHRVRPPAHSYAPMLRTRCTVYHDHRGQPADSGPRRPGSRDCRPRCLYPRCEGEGHVGTRYILHL
jgi:cation-transporting ATPase 13A1